MLLDLQTDPPMAPLNTNGLWHMGLTEPILLPLKCSTKSMGKMQRRLFEMLWRLQKKLLQKKCPSKFTESHRCFSRINGIFNRLYCIWKVILNRQAMFVRWMQIKWSVTINSLPTSTIIFLGQKSSSVLWIHSMFNRIIVDEKYIWLEVEANRWFYYRWKNKHGQWKEPWLPSRVNIYSWSSRQQCEVLVWREIRWTSGWNSLLRSTKSWSDYWTLSSVVCCSSWSSHLLTVVELQQFKRKCESSYCKDIPLMVTRSQLMFSSQWDRQWNIIALWKRRTKIDCRCWL